MIPCVASLLKPDSRLWRTAKWRQGPASAAQSLFVAKRWGYVHKTVRDFREHSDGDEFPERLKNLTKGDAANIITRLKHGAQVSGFHVMARTAMTLSPKASICQETHGEPQARDSRCKGEATTG